jgi:hypothetical protein
MLKVAVGISDKERKSFPGREKPRSKEAKS